jgi:hypothetical protein
MPLLLTSVVSRPTLNSTHTFSLTCSSGQLPAAAAAARLHRIVAHAHTAAWTLHVYGGPSASPTYQAARRVARTSCRLPSASCTQSMRTCEPTCGLSAYMRAGACAVHRAQGMLKSALRHLASSASAPSPHRHHPIAHRPARAFGHAARWSASTLSLHCWWTVRPCAGNR